MSSSKPIKPKLRELFMIISGEVSQLHTIWDLYIQLYGSSDENYELMNESAPQFFAIIKDVLFDELVLILNRLTENAKTNNKDNASLEQLIENLNQDNNGQLIKSLTAKLESIKTNSGSFRIWRNKKVTHNDLLTALDKDSDVLPGITRGKVQDVINEVADYINEFSVELFGEQQVYKPFIFAHGDGIALMQYLKRIKSETNDRET